MWSLIDFLQNDTPDKNKAMANLIGTIIWACEIIGAEGSYEPV